MKIKVDYDTEKMENFTAYVDFKEAHEIKNLPYELELIIKGLINSVAIEFPEDHQQSAAVSLKEFLTEILKDDEDTDLDSYKEALGL